MHLTVTMPQLNTEQRTFVLESYFRSNSTTQVMQEFTQRFPERHPPPTRCSIIRLVNKFRTRGSILNQNAGRSGRRRTTRTPENIERVRLALEENPRLSTTRNGLGISRAGMSEIIRLDLNWHPYRMRVRHQLNENDRLRRMHYSQWIIQKFQDATFLGKIVVGDEAGFAMNGRVNTHNVIQYAPKGQPPNFHFDVSASRDKVTVWAALSGNGHIIGPFFFDENVNGESYLNMLNEEVIPEMNILYDFDAWGDVRFQQNVWWFQDGAPCHRRRIVIDRLRELFGGQVVAFNHENEWPARSPDLTPCDFFLFSCSYF